MPYITRARREDFQGFLEKVRTLRIDSAGELNFLLVMLGQTYLSQHGMTYKVFNDIIGALECTKIETYRRQIANLEDIKKQENGEVFLSVPGTE